MRLNLGSDDLLSTTRAVRKRLDLTRDVEAGVIDECLDAALQAPTGSNAQGWHFIVVRDTEVRAGLADLYRKAFSAYLSMQDEAAADAPPGPDTDTQQRVRTSAEYLADHLHEVPVHMIPCIYGRPEGLHQSMVAGLYGSILPATWSYMLAARDRGLGTAWTTLHLVFEEQAAELLGVPYDQVTQVGLIPTAYTQGTDFKPGPRRDKSKVIHHDRW
ncbi:MAG: nitroreductase family protein [Microthrixaceae bacterium]